MGRAVTMIVARMSVWRLQRANNEFALSAGEGIQLRLPRVDDSARLHAEIERYRHVLREWLSWADNAQAYEETKAFVENARRGYSRGEGFALVVLVQGQIAGVIGFHAFDRRNRVTSLGYWLSPWAQGQGVMTRSVEACMRYAFEERGMNRLYVRCATGNLKSRAVPERLGFVHEGRQREAELLPAGFVDLEVYSMLKREWVERLQIQARMRRGAD